jgi:cytidine deaminase
LQEILACAPRIGRRPGAAPRNAAARRSAPAGICANSRAGMTERNFDVEPLIEAARATLASRLRAGRHYVGAALRTRSGQVFSAVNLGATVGRASVCAEAIALGMAAAAGDTDVDLVVAVNERGAVVSPCGLCRENLSDFAPGARVVVREGEGVAVVPIAALLPHKFAKDA